MEHQMGRNARRRGPGAALGSALFAAAVLVALDAGPAHAGAGWSEFRQSSLKGAIYSSETEDGVFLLVCDKPLDGLLQATFPKDSQVKAGQRASLSFAVDGRRFSYSGKVLDTDGGDGKVLMAEAKVGDPLVKALAKGKALKVSKGRASYEVSLDGAAGAVAFFVESCGAQAKPAPAEAQAAAQVTPQATAQEAPSAGAAPKVEASASKQERGSSAVPSAQEIAATIFVDKQEGQRLAGKLKVTPIDLNGDGASEAIVTVKDPGWCSENGCTLFVVDFSKGTPHIIGEFIGSSLTPAKSMRGEWRDLNLNAPGGTELESFVDGGYR